MEPSGRFARNYGKGIYVNQKSISVLLALLLARVGVAATLVPSSITVLATQAATGNPKAEVALGERYQAGIGVEQSFEKAFDLYTQAAEQGNRQGEFDLGNLYYLGLGLPQDSAKAIQWFEKAASQGSTDADEILAEIFLTGKGVPQDPVQAATWYQRAAELGDTLAQVHLADFYQNGTGVKKDDQKALLWYRRAAARGSAVAETSLGWAYLNGLGVKKDTAASQEWYLKAAGQDSPEAELALGEFYLQGRFGKPDYAKALKWLTKSAGHDNSDAEFLLGGMYRLGYGVTKDDATAVSWYQKASDLGDPQAEMQLAGAYYSGITVPIDKQKAIALIQTAANGQYAAAEMALSTMYFAGRDMPRDAVQGKVWLDRAIAQNYPHALCEAAAATLYGLSSDADRAQALVDMQAQAKAGDELCINDLAWYLATKTGVKPEDLSQSAEMMEKLVAANPKNSAYVDTMAAVEAAETHYDAAVTDEQKAIDIATPYLGAEGFLKVANERLALYRSHKPYIVPPAASTTPAAQSSTTKPTTAVAPAIQTEPVNGCYTEEPAKVALTGVLTTVMYSDPQKNNSVNNNRLERGLLLSFRPAICSSGGLDPRLDMREIQLIYVGGTPKLYDAIGQYKGEKVRCVGEIWGSDFRITDVSACQPVP